MQIHSPILKNVQNIKNSRIKSIQTKLNLKTCFNMCNNNVTFVVNPFFHLSGGCEQLVKLTYKKWTFWMRDKISHRYRFIWWILENSNYLIKKKSETSWPNQHDRMNITETWWIWPKNSHRLILKWWTWPKYTNPSIF